MPEWLATVVAGTAAGLVASAVMNAFQSATASLFGQEGGDGDPATVQAADAASRIATGHTIRRTLKERAGSAVHYATGAALGIAYALLVAAHPGVALGFGVAFGLVVAVVLDDLLVPAFGWGPWPWATPLKTHGYSLVSHAVFGLALEAVRRLVSGLLG